MRNKDVAIPIVFPDYLISVESPAVVLTVPDLLPRIDILPGRISLPRRKHKPLVAAPATAGQP